MSSPENRWAYVVVIQMISTQTQPIFVNVYGFPTKSEAQAFQRKDRKERTSEGVKVIADRVRPIIDDEFLEKRLAEG